MGYNKITVKNDLIADQNFAWELIKQAVENKRLGRSYLFFGPVGSGRKRLARAFAQGLNCQQRLFPPCLECISCKKIENYNHPDVHYLEKQNSNFIKIEQIHQMQRQIILRSFEAEFKVFIIFSAQDLTAEASNALLKVLEEPPNHSVIILITSDLSRLYSTIISRCQKIRFFPRGRSHARAILERDYNFNKEASHFLDYIFEGQLNSALKFQGRDVLASKNQIIQQFIIKPDVALEKFNVKDKEELIWCFKILTSCIRDIYLLKSDLSPQELINADVADQLSRVAKRLNFADLNRILQQISDMFDNARQNVNSRLLVENQGLLLK